MLRKGEIKMPKIKNTEFNQLLKTADLTCSQVARRMKVSRSLVYYWLTGRQKPNIERLKQMQVILNCELKDLLKIFYQIEL